MRWTRRSSRPSSRGGSRRVDRRLALELAEGARSRLLSLLEALIAAPSPRGSSAAQAQARVGDYLERNGFAVETSEDSWEAARDHPEWSPPPPSAEAPVNLIARARNLPAPRLAFFAHADTEAPGDGWTAPPFEAVVRRGRIHGLGAADDKGGLAAAAVAAALLARHHREAPLVASVHSKGGGSRGALPVVSGIRDRADWVYIHPPENGAGLRVLKSASRGVLDVTVRVTGWRGRPREIGTPESAPFEEGGNALEALLAVVGTLRRGELADCDLNLGRVVAGDAPGLTPARCDAGIRVLFRGAQTAAGVLAAIRRAAARSGFRFGLTPTGVRANPASTPWNDPFPAGLRAAAFAVTGERPAAYADHLASDIRFPVRLHGASAIGIGSLAGNFYGPDEWVDLDDLVRLVAVLVLFGSRAGVRDGGRASAT